MQTIKRLGDVVALQRWPGASTETLQWLGRLMSEEGIDLTLATADQLERGSAVYATVEADVNEVQRLMAHHHILRLPVVDGGKLVGIVDLVELALRASGQDPEPPLAAAGA
jgi:CBS domain-containing protein